MKVLPIHRLQSYFRELEAEEDRKLKAAGFEDVKLADYDGSYIGQLPGSTPQIDAWYREFRATPQPPRDQCYCPDCRYWQTCTAAMLVAMGLVVWACGR
jgi:hypothetical protein